MRPHCYPYATMYRWDYRTKQTICEAFYPRLGWICIATLHSYREGHAS